MTELERKALLPAGLRDVLPPFAAFEAEVIERLMARFAASGYARIKAPLVEFEDGLLSGPGAAMTAETFRLMDPVSQRMMGVRADITPQIARIASTRLRAAPRPLRLGYSGEVLRVKGTQLRPERQFAQVGAELIGAESAAADTEMILLAVDALGAVGVSDLTVDLTIPPLVPALLDAAAIDEGPRVALREALDHKDSAAVAANGGAAADILRTLVEAAGPADHCFAVLGGLDLPGAAALERDRVGEVLECLRDAAPTLTITLDPVENRGFEYHSGVSFTLFPAASRGELGAGGRYQAAGVGESEPATGFSLYLDTVLRVLPEPESPARIYLPAGTDAAVDQRLRGDGWITIGGLDPTADAGADAGRLECTHAWLGGEVRPAGRE
jgi:ATP phosphoribosyltransferase regulatory subunit